MWGNLDCNERTILATPIFLIISFHPLKICSSHQGKDKRRLVSGPQSKYSDKGDPTPSAVRCARSRSVADHSKANSTPPSVRCAQNSRYGSPLNKHQRKRQREKVINLVPKAQSIPPFPKVSTGPVSLPGPLLRQPHPPSLSPPPRALRI
jgi:hypothetical protein